jgi:HTH-type transcriptional regulator/antitoxin HigA
VAFGCFQTRKSVLGFIRAMKPKVIKTAAEHSASLAHIDRLMDAKKGSPQEAELELWSLLVEKCEEKHFPIAPPDPIRRALVPCG